MNIPPIQSPVNTANISVENLAGNQHLTQQQKIAEASRQFESIMLRQILSESQKPVFESEFTDNSTAAGIYQDYMTNTLADSISKAGTLGFAKIFERQLSHHPAKADETGPKIVPAATAKPVAALKLGNFHNRNPLPVSIAQP